MGKFMSTTTFVLLVAVAILTLAETRPQEEGLLDRKLVKMLTQLISKQDMVSSRSEKTMDKMLNKKKKQYPECGGSFTAPKGVLKSPGYPGHYYNNMNCEYRIFAEEGTTIVVDFKTFSVEGPVSENCPYDYIQQIDYNPDGSFYYGDKLCGPYLDHGRFESPSNNIAFRFVTDHDKTEAGFLAVWYTRPAAAIAVAPTPAPGETNHQLHSTGCGLRPLAKNNGESEIYDFAKRIVGGHHATQNTWPSICRMSYKIKVHDATWTSSCAATLVKNNQGLFFLITAAHCTNTSVAERDYQIYCGIHYLHQTNDPSKALKISHIDVHAGYNHYNSHNDIAILFFEHQPEESNLIQAACIADEDHMAYETSIIVGWGLTIDNKTDSGSNILKQVMTKLLPDDDCMQEFPHIYEKSMMMCSYRKNSGSCQGDSGGPVFTYRYERWTLAGVNSFGGEVCGDYSYAADVYDFRGWIDRLINRY